MLFLLVAYLVTLQIFFYTSVNQVRLQVQVRQLSSYQVLAIRYQAVQVPTEYLGRVLQTCVLLFEFFFMKTYQPIGIPNIHIIQSQTRLLGNVSEVLSNRKYMVLVITAAMNTILCLSCQQPSMLLSGNVSLLQNSSQLLRQPLLFHRRRQHSCELSEMFNIPYSPQKGITVKKIGVVEEILSRLDDILMIQKVSESRDP